jgi:nicotinate-nucleotide adenylyltransferase
MTSRRIGILGGTFDPVHCGHLDAGAAAQVALGLGEVLVLPSNDPPHRLQPEASAYHRFAMVALAIAGRPSWRALDLELREGARSYTSDTLERFHAEGFDATELFFIAGADAFVEIATWKNYPALLDLAHFVVVSRPGGPVAELPARLGTLRTAYAKASSFADASSSAGGSADRSADKSADETSDRTMIFLIDAVTADVSSTVIRRCRAQGKSIVGMVPPAVQQHIEQHALYTDATPMTGTGTRVVGRRAGRLRGQD